MTTKKRKKLPKIKLKAGNIQTGKTKTEKILSKVISKVLEKDELDIDTPFKNNILDLCAYYGNENVIVVLNADGVKVDIPSFRVKVGSTIALKDNSKDHKSVKEALENVTTRVEYIDFDKNTNSAKYVRLPERNELNADINEALIVEFYNR